MLKHHWFMLWFELTFVKGFDSVGIITYVPPLHKLLPYIYLITLTYRMSFLCFLLILHILQNTSVFNGNLLFNLGWYFHLPDNFAVRLRVAEHFRSFPNCLIGHDLVVVDDVAWRVLQKGVMLFPVDIVEFGCHKRLRDENLLADKILFDFSTCTDVSAHLLMHLFFLLRDGGFEVVGNCKLYLFGTGVVGLLQWFAGWSHYVGRRLHRFLQLMHV